ncbi:hypothetical protein T05_419 [Trichinella murrelli]|uniref:Uncharacterized protein n=1 Tax=Trichinella murrelli TaxID=144512 RepID=A0A0V0UI65_9BILA|nr:hypothetical protein T05_419 [Trichinella murrelli]
MKLIAIKSAPECQIELRHIQNQSYKRLFLLSSLHYFDDICELVFSLIHNANTHLGWFENKFMQHDVCIRYNCWKRVSND